MSQRNPYDSFLDGRPVEEILESTPKMIVTLLDAMGKDKTLTPPMPGKWSPAEIVCHMADCELVFGFRLRQALAEDSPVIQPFDQEKWAATYVPAHLTTALDTFTALREWNLLLIDGALPDAADRPITHLERGAMTFQTIVETIAGHDLNHVAQLKRIAGVE